MEKLHEWLHVELVLDLLAGQRLDTFSVPTSVFLIGDGEL